MMPVASCLLAANAVEFLDELGIVDEHGDPEAADLLFACGLLTREWVAEGRAFEVVAAPIFPGETAAVYRSLVVARVDGPTDLHEAQEATLAVNEYGSWSGWHGYVDDLRRHDLPTPSRRVTTGGHRASVQTVRADSARVAAIDSSLWRWLPADEREGVRVIHETIDWPAPPFSLRHGVDPEVVAGLVNSEQVVAAATADYDFMLDARTPVS